MINEEKLAEFLAEHKRNPENFNEEGNYDPNPYWLAEEIVKFCNLQNVNGSFSADDMERAYNDGIETEQPNGYNFNIENYR